MSTSLDPRAIRSQTMLKNALLQLLLEGKQLHQLSVQKVTTHAGLNRTTFYLHYHALEHLKEQMTQEVLTQLTLKITVLMKESSPNRQEQVVDMLTYLYEQRTLLTVLNQFDAVEKHLFALFKELINTRRKQPVKPKRTHYIDSDIKTASIVGVILWWLKNEQSLPALHVAEQIELMNQQP